MYKDKIYDITAWDMTKRLEIFLNKKLGANKEGRVSRTKENKDVFVSMGKKYEDESQCKGIQTLGDKMLYFTKWVLAEQQAVPVYAKDTIKKSRWKIRKLMLEINDIRVKIAHPGNLEPVLDYGKFEEFQEKCFKLDNFIRNIWGDSIRIKEVIPTLEYDMGNVGDIIKHGLLAEFLEWWATTRGNQKLQIADTFAGCPWSNIYAGSGVKERLRNLEKTALGKAQIGNKLSDEISDVYLGSSYLMHSIAAKLHIPVNIIVSDNNKDARCNWKSASTKNMKLETIGEKNDGYEILNKAFRKNLDLILIDPYSVFLRDEFYRIKKEETPKNFARILKLVKNNPNLFVAVFVLDLDKTNDVGKEFNDFKEIKLSSCAYSIRAPKINKDKTSIRGESGFDSEILLIGKQIAEGKCGALRERLKDCAKAATGVLKPNLSDGEEVKFWPPGE